MTTETTGETLVKVPVNKLDEMRGKSDMRVTDIRKFVQVNSSNQTISMQFKFNNLNTNLRALFKGLNLIS